MIYSHDHQSFQSAILAFNLDIQQALDKLWGAVGPPPTVTAKPGKPEYSTQIDDHKAYVDAFKKVWWDFWKSDEARVINEKHGFYPCDPVGNPPIIPVGRQWIGPPTSPTDYDPIRDIPGPKKTKSWNQK
jgi:hypothetical protein